MPKNNIAAFLFILFVAVGAFGESNSETPNGTPKPRRSVVADFDGDGKTDISVNRGYEGGWHIRRSSDNAYQVANFGLNGDQFVPGDYDGDGKADLAVMRRFISGSSTIHWYILNSSDSTVSYKYFGYPNDRPVVGDYDGDGKTDVAVFRDNFDPRRTWFISRSSDGVDAQIEFGNSGDHLVPADYDGDGKTDLAVYDPPQGSFRILNSSDFSITTRAWAAAQGYSPVIGDYDGDGRADPAFFIYDRRSSTRGRWIVMNGSGEISEERSVVPRSSHLIRGDYDGDGKDDPGYFHSPTGKWHIKYSSNNLIYEEFFGATGDIPVSISWFTS